MNSTQLESHSPSDDLKKTLCKDIKIQSIIIEDILEDSDNFKLLEQKHKAAKLYDILNLYCPL